jgi:polyisoprenoid-binding protein YceI
MSTTEQLAPTGTWTVDPVHSTAEFAVRHMVVNTFRTTFKTIEATVDLDGDQPRILGKVPVESIDITQEGFRAHVLSPEFFDAERHPAITFESTGVHVGDDGALTVEGNLTIKGITRPVSAQGAISGPVTDLAGNPRLGVELETVVDRREFGLDWNAPLPSGGLAVDYDVKLSVHLELVGQA